MTIVLLYGGHEDTIDGVKARVVARYPQARVVIVDWKNNNVNKNVMERSVRREIFETLKAVKGKLAVYIAQPCTTYGNCLGVQMRGQSKQSIWGLPNLEPALDKLVQDHNVLSNFTQDVMEVL